MRSTTFRAGSMMTACRSCAGCMTPRSSRGAPRSGGWLAKWWANIPSSPAGSKRILDETLTFYRLPRQHHEHLKSTNMLERLNEEIKRRTHVSCASSLMPRAACGSRGSLLCTTWTRCLDRVSGQVKHDGSELNRRTSPKWVRIQPALTAAPLSQHGRFARAQEEALRPAA